MSGTGDNSKKMATNRINKKRYNIFSQKLCDILGMDQCDKEAIHRQILAVLCEVTKFDPTASTYVKEKVARLREKTGKSTYELFQKDYYMKNKEELDKKKVVEMRERRAMAKKMLAKDS